MSLERVAPKKTEPAQLRSQHRREGTEEGRSAQEECLVLSDAERGTGGRPVHELDSHLSVVRRQLLRLPDRTGAPRPETRDQPRGVDAVELLRDASWGPAIST